MSGFNMQRFHAAGQDYEIDPVCEMKVDPKNPPFKILYKDRIYFFVPQYANIYLNVFQRNTSKQMGLNHLGGHIFASLRINSTVVNKRIWINSIVLGNSAYIQLHLNAV